MSMFLVTGRVEGVFNQERKVDKETGEIPAPQRKVQIMGVLPVMGGDSKKELITLSVPDGIDFKPFVEKKVAVPIGVFSPAKGQIIYFIPQGSKVRELS